MPLPPFHNLHKLGKGAVPWAERAAYSMHLISKGYGFNERQSLVNNQGTDTAEYQSFKRWLEYTGIPEGGISTYQDWLSVKAQHQAKEPINLDWLPVRLQKQIEEAQAVREEEETEALRNYLEEQGVNGAPDDEESPDGAPDDEESPDGEEPTGKTTESVETFGNRRFLMIRNEQGVLIDWIDLGEMPVEGAPTEEERFEWQKGEAVIAREEAAKARQLDALLRRENLLASLTGPRDWIKYWQMRKGGRPPAPEWLPKHAPSQIAGQPITRGATITPSGQGLAGLKETERAGLWGFADWAAQEGGESQTAADILSHMEMMMPGQPRGAGREQWIPFSKR